MLQHSLESLNKGSEHFHQARNSAVSMLETQLRPKEAQAIAAKYPAREDQFCMTLESSCKHT